nr:MAG TPA: hypothetical protein [Bacteriophage sp.]
MYIDTNTIIEVGKVLEPGQIKSFTVAIGF